MSSLLPRGALLDDGQAGDALPVVPQAPLEFVQEAPVDVEDNLHVAGQQLLQQADRPLLQGLQQHRVVGERKHLLAVCRSARYRMSFTIALHCCFAQPRLCRGCRDGDFVIARFDPES